MISTSWTSYYKYDHVTNKKKKQIRQIAHSPVAATSPSISPPTSLCICVSSLSDEGVRAAPTCFPRSRIFKVT